MKIKLTKKGMTRYCQDYEQELLESAGWVRADSAEQAGEEVIRLKPTVKPKSTVKDLEEAKADTETVEATNQQGDE